MLSVFEIVSLILVGATWGCSNSFLRKGSTEAAAAAAAADVSSTKTTNDQTEQDTAAAAAAAAALEHQHQQKHSTSTWMKFIKEQLYKFRRVSVWLPYVINQSGSILFYITLSQTDISIAVPACNALSLVFSIFTSWFILNEPIEQPLPTIIGATCIMAGVAICVQAASSN